MWKAYSRHLGLSGGEDNFQSEIGLDHSFYIGGDTSLTCKIRLHDKKENCNPNEGVN